MGVSVCANNELGIANNKSTYLAICISRRRVTNCCCIWEKIIAFNKLVVISRYSLAQAEFLDQPDCNALNTNYSAYAITQSELGYFVFG